jgi:glycerol-3-phosphate dehydrogenase
LRYLPNAKQAGLCGGVKYWDGQFDDARLALALAKTAARAGALVINYCQATDLIHHAGKVAGLQCQDQETGQRYDVQARCVVNATGVWVDTLRQADARATGRTARAMVAPSQGVHVVVDRAYLPTDHALLIPKTADARVLFAVPWLGKTILGTTDSPRQTLDREPNALKEELDFILNESARYLQRAPTKADIKSVWVGLRPLVKPSADDGESTQALSREHTVLCSRSGLVTVTGGKWTTYRAMAEDVLDNCFEHGLLEERERCTTAHHRLVGAGINSIANKSNKISGEPGLHSYGNEADEVQSHAGADQFLAPGLTEAMVRFAVRCEYARTVEDILARRSRLLFLDAALAKAIAPQIAEILAKEALPSPALAAFVALADHYLQMPS